jgi:hypothetical protein
MRNRSPLPPTPNVDFTKEVVLVVGWGTKGVLGYSTWISRIEKTPKEIRVLFRREGPPKDRVAPTMVGYPCFLARMDKPDLPVRFVLDQD